VRRAAGADGGEGRGLRPALHPAHQLGEIIVRLNAALVESLADPALVKRFGEMGQEIPAPAEQTPQALGARHRADIEKWWPLIKGANIKAE